MASKSKTNDLISKQSLFNCLPKSDLKLVFHFEGQTFISFLPREAAEDS